MNMSKLEIHVGNTLEDMKQRVVDAVTRSRQGEAVREEHVTFETWEALASVMTTKRLEMLRHLNRNPEASVASLARILKRDYKRVYEDVKALSDAGLIERTDHGLRAEYDEIRTQIAL
jgi:predicted transcriptional regulator